MSAAVTPQPQVQKGREPQRQQQVPSRGQAGQSSAAVQLKAHLADKGYDEQAAILAPPGPWAAHGATTEALQAKGPMDEGAGVHQAAAHGIKGGGGQLPHAEKIQAAFGSHDVSSVQAHVGGQAAEASKAMGAEAYATGNDVAFANAPTLHTAAHEAAHIVQQRTGVSLSGGVGQVGDSYEQHADKVADAVVAGQSAEPLLNQMSGGAPGAEVQRRETGAVQRGGGPAGAAVAAAAGRDSEPSSDAPAATSTASGGGAAAGASGDRAAAPDAAAAADPETAAQEEDRAAFHDIDGEIDIFRDEPAITSYFTARVPSDWAATQPDSANIMRKSRERGLSAPEVYALVGYTGPAYNPMNRLTRGQMKSNLFKGAFQPYVTRSSAALGKLDDGAVKRSQRGWREIPNNGDPSIITGLYDREYVDERGFMSTTENAGQDFFAGPVSLQINATSGVRVQHFSLNPSEGEILFAPGTRFKVDRFQRNADVEAGWRAWHADNTQPKPDKPWFEVDLREQ